MHIVPQKIVSRDGTIEFRIGGPSGKLHNSDGPAIIHSDGSKEYYINGNLHRLDGPAAIWANGDKAYYKNGYNHRIGGPAIIWKTGTEFWYVEGKLHRENGPAVIWSNGIVEYWVNGQMIVGMSQEKDFKVEKEMIKDNVVSLDKYREKRSQHIRK